MYVLMGIHVSICISFGQHSNIFVPTDSLAKLMMQDMYVMYTTLYFYVVVTYSVIHCRLGWTLLVQIRSRQ
jgi:hypothetical protein